MGMLAEYSTYKQLLPSTMRHLALSTHDPIGSENNSAGWHFTFLDDTDGDKIIKKLDSYAHHTDYMPGYSNYSKKDIVSEMFKKHRLKKVEITAPEFPDYLVENLDKFSKYVFKDGEIEG